MRVAQQSAAIDFFGAFAEQSRTLEARQTDICLQDSARAPGAFDAQKLPEVGSKKYSKRMRNSRKQSKQWFKRVESKRIEAAARQTGIPYPPPWFHDDVESRGEAESRLETAPKGTFLIRCAETDKGFSLTVKDDIVCRNFRIAVEIDLMYSMTNAPRQFATLQELIDHFHVDMLTDEGLVLVQPLPRPVLVVDTAGTVEYVEVSFEGGVVMVAPSGHSVELDPRTDDAVKSIVAQELVALSASDAYGAAHDYRLDQAAQRVVDRAQSREYGRPLSEIFEADDGEYHPSTVPSSPRYSVGDVPDLVLNDVFVGYGNFDIILDRFSSISQLCLTPPVSCAMLYLVPMLTGC